MFHFPLENVSLPSGIVFTTLWQVFYHPQVNVSLLLLANIHFPFGKCFPALRQMFHYRLARV
jgi:hypothetical protein